MTTTTSPVDPIGADLHHTLKQLKLGQMAQTLPERLVLARHRKLSHAAFLELILGDEIGRRESRSAMLRARDRRTRSRRCGSTPGTSSTTSPTTANSSPTSSPCGSPKPVTGCSSSARSESAKPTSPPRSGHIAIRRRLSVHAARADKLFTRLRAARLDNTLDAELRRLARVDVLILDDFALKPLDATQTNDFYELIVERHHRASTIVTSNREPAEWLTMMSDALLAQSAVDRLTSGAHTLIIEGPSYRQRPRRRADLDHQGEHQ